MTLDFDAIVVGAGPVGLSTGILLAKQGIHTLVCERKALPVDKACGEGIMPTGLAELKNLGVLERLSPLHSHPFEGIRYFDQHGNSAAASFAQGAGLGIRRVELSRALHEEALTLDNLHIEQNIEVTHVDRRDGQVKVHAHAKNFSAKLLIGADGVRSNIRRWSNLEAAPSHLRRWGANQHFAIMPWSPYVEVYWTPGLEAYVTPCGSEQVGVAFLWNRDDYKPVASGKKLALGLLEQFPTLQHRLASTPLVGETQSIGPLHRRVRSCVSDNLVLVGDAAGYLDPITGEGISLGLSAARRLSEFALPLFARQHLEPHINAFSNTNLLPFDQLMQKQNRHYYSTTKLVLMMSKYPRVVEQVVQELQQNPDLFQHLLSANMGQAKLFGFKPHKTLQIGFSLMMEMCSQAPTLLFR
jgi:2-polyprenyl-6-methoxyphenol hydroxylase-like FAD-dependent oxidoreductase